MADPNPTDLHTRAVHDFMHLVVGPMLEAGATPEQLLVMMESAVAGVVLAIVRLGGDQPVIDTFCEGIKARLAEQRLSNIDPAGRA